MIPVRAIDAETFVLPEGTERRTFVAPAGSEAEIAPLPTLVLPSGAVVMQWVPNAEERERLGDGEPVTIIMHSGGRVAPLSVGVGGFDLR